MTTCTRCGHQIEVGRFCTNCGAPVEAGPGPTDTAERPAVRLPTSPPPPPLPPAPTRARFPLFADEVGAEGPPPPSAPPSGPPPPPPPPPTGGRPAHRRRTGWLVWVVVAAVLVVVALAGASLLLTSGDDGDGERVDDPAAGATPSAEGSPTPAPETEDPGDDPGDDPGEEAPAGEPVNVAGTATAEVPATAPVGTDVDGARIRYGAAQMLDDDPTTCWRMTGDGTGREIVLTLAEPTTVTALGLINGYAKTARDGRGRALNWYAGNRRILAVEWELDDGTVVPQDLQESRSLQAVEIDPVETTRVVLRLVEVSGVGKGRAARDNTAVSEVAVVGTPAG